MEAALLRKVPFFSSLKEKDLKKLARLTSLHTYKSDNIILMESEAGISLYLIAKGSVKVSRMSIDGKEVILSILKEGDFFGELSLLDGQARSATVTAIEDSELLILRRDDFLQIIKEHPELSIFLLKELARRIRKSDAQIKSLSLLNAAGRVGTVFIQSAETGGIIRDGKAYITKLPSQQNIAGMTGMTRETVSRAVRLLIEEKLVSKSGTTIIIEDFEKFKEMYS
ncbi:Crp/Fnr family transcriptional regulator [candidate division KSB1 bacterium]